MVLYTPSKNLKNNIDKLTSKEKEYLGNFFQYSTKISSFAYVLFGDKPMSIEFYDKSKPFENIDDFDYMDDYHIAHKYRFKEGWEVLMKNQHLFPSENFIFFEYPNNFNPDFMEICVINKKSFLDTVEKYLSEFRSVLKKDLSSQEILEAYVNRDACFDSIYKHDGLLGTLFGYGKYNAWAFMQQADMQNPTMQLFHNEDPCEINNMLLPNFKVIPNTEETLKLDYNYRKQREEIEGVFKNNEYLELSLKKIVYNQ
jgi:hypothetical protein